MPRSSFYYKEIKRNYYEAKEVILSPYKKNKNRDGYRPMTLKLRQKVKRYRVWVAEEIATIMRWLKAFLQY